MLEKTQIVKNSRERQRDLLRSSVFKRSSLFSLGSVLSGNFSPNSFRMPISGRLGVSFSVPVVSGNLEITSGLKSMKTKTLISNELALLDFFEVGKLISIKSLSPGTVSLFFISRNKKKILIASGSFT